MFYNVRIHLTSDFMTTVEAESSSQAECMIEDQICQRGLSSIDTYDEDTILDNLNIEFIEVEESDEDC